MGNARPHSCSSSRFVRTGVDLAQFTPRVLPCASSHVGGAKDTQILGLGINVDISSLTNATLHYTVHKMIQPRLHLPHSNL